MWLWKERVNNLQTVQEWNKSYIGLIALYGTQKLAIIFGESRAIMALDDSRWAN